MQPAYFRIRRKQDSSRDLAFLSFNDRRIDHSRESYGQKKDILVDLACRRSTIERCANDRVIERL
ncbi:MULTISPECIES: hypothetical protein [Hyphomonas]|jgi:hypothetical protein|uniref:hypothetical protein n=1 Tax=Hyphomonas TaxID=85 RepID=UPI0035183692|tara:strand:- start:153 stop:347 length:195 start_codon:yes stop_codon:yes gene_type:complete